MKNTIFLIFIYLYYNEKCVTNAVIVNSVIPGIKLRAQSGREDHSVYPEYKSLVGGRAELPCNVTLPTPEDAITLILWYRGENRTPIYTVDARENAQLINGRHFASADAFGANRAHFKLNTQPALLKIDPVKDDDDYEYRCRVDFRWGRTMSTFVRLNVIVPPRKVIIKDELGRPLHDLIGPYNEDSNLRLQCEAEGGKPPPSLLWYREDQMIDDSYSHSIDNKTIHNDVLIINLTRSDLNAKYSCQAYHPNFTAPIQTSVRLDINLKPLDIRLNSLDGQLSAGGSVELVCNTGGSRPPAKITWLRDNRPLIHSSERTETVGNLTTSAITYTPSAEDHGVYLSCRSENIRLANSSIEIGYTLNVYFAPQVTLLMGTTGTKSSIAQHISEGDEIFMKCQISAHPHTYVIQFFFNGTQIVDNSDGVFINNSSLVIKSVRRQHSGRYQCFANNSEGRGESNELVLAVTYPPVCRSQKRVFGAALGEAVKIPCSVTASPPDVAFQWTVNNAELLASFASFGLESTLTFTPKTKRDFGVIACRAKNSVGVQRDPCVFSIISAGLPSPVTGCLVVNQTSTSILIDCISGDDGGLEQEFHLELFESADHRLVANRSVKHRAEFRLQDLSSGTQYLALVYASNAKGRSAPIELTVPTLALLNRKFVADSPHTEDISLVLAVVLGLGLVAILVLMISVIICRIRTKNRRKEAAEDRQRRDGAADGRRLSINGDIFADHSSKEDLTEILDTGGDRKNPDVIPPIDGYSVNLMPDKDGSGGGGGGGVVTHDDNGLAFHQQIQAINSISSNHRLSMNTQSIGNYPDKQTAIFPGADQLLCITLTPDPIVNFINSTQTQTPPPGVDDTSKTLHRQRVFPLSTPV